MGLFPSANDFKAGKGVEKNAPRKTGIGRFFELVGRDMNGMFLANLLTCIGFAPVICLVYIGFLQNSLPVMLGSAAVGGLLAGPALAGMYDTVLRALRDEAGYWWVTYRKAFKRNFKASLVPGVLYTVVVTLQIFLVYFCFNMLYHGTNVGVPLWVATVLNLVEGIEVFEPSHIDECCGFGGMFAVEEQAVSVCMGRDKVKDHMATGAEYIVGADSSCLMHMQGVIKREHLPIQIIHIVEILASQS